MSSCDDCLIHFAFPRQTAHKSSTIDLQCYISGPRFFPNDRPIFHEDPDLAMLGVYIQTRLASGDTEHVLFVIPVRDILTEAKLEDRPQTPPRRGYRMVPWGHWGPLGTRIFQVDSEPHIITAMGPHVVIPLTNPTLGVTQHLFVADVRLHSEAESLGRLGGDYSLALGVPEGRVDASDTLARMKSFDTTLTGHLPFRMTYAEAWSDSDACLVVGQALTHDGIVMTVRPSPSDIRQRAPTVLIQPAL